MIPETGSAILFRDIGTFRETVVGGAVDGAVDEVPKRVYCKKEKPQDPTTRPKPYREPLHEELGS